jgi:hypothetical protein
MLIFFVLILCAAGIGAQEKNRDSFPYTLGAGIEFGLNTRENFAIGYTAALDRVIYNSPVSAGLRGTMYNDLNSVTATEAELTLRLNLFKLWRGEFFTQLGWGWAFYREDDNTVNTFILDVVLGYRFYFFGGFYVEPFIRGGYPYQINVGILGGHWFSF